MRALSCRLTKAENIFREEAKVPEGISMDIAAEVSMFDELLLFSVADGDSSRFVHEYHSLAAWVDASLDLYKACPLKPLQDSGHAAKDFTASLDPTVRRFNSQTQPKSWASRLQKCYRRCLHKCALYGNDIGEPGGWLHRASFRRCFGQSSCSATHLL